METENTRLLVECGRPTRDVVGYLAHVGLTPDRLDGILLTHAHGDHIRSAREISDAHGLPVFASRGTLGRSNLRDSSHARAIEADSTFVIGDVEIRPFSVPHDCAEPLGFRFESATARAGFATDLGWVPDSVRAHFSDLDLLVLEANYDPGLLHAGRYPAFLKARVGGYRGHLANQDAGHAIASCGDHAPRNIWLAHLSQENNSPRAALSTIGSMLRVQGLGHVALAAARHRYPSLAWDSAASLAEQLPLF